MLKFPARFTVCPLVYSEMPQTAQNHSYLSKPQQGSHVGHPSTKSSKLVDIAEALLLNKTLYKV